MLADFLRRHRDDIVADHEVRLRHRRPSAGSPASPSARRTGAPSRSGISSRARCAGSRRTTSTSISCTTPRIEPILDDDLWAELERSGTQGKVRELGVALGPAIGWVEEGVRAVRDRPIVSLQTVFNVLEQEPGLTFAASRECATERSG